VTRVGKRKDFFGGFGAAPEVRGREGSHRDVLREAPDFDIDLSLTGAIFLILLLPSADYGHSDDFSRVRAGSFVMRCDGVDADPSPVRCSFVKAFSNVNPSINSVNPLFDNVNPSYQYTDPSSVRISFSVKTSFNVNPS